MPLTTPVTSITKETPKPLCYGLIYGITGGVFEHANWIVRFATLKFEHRTTKSGFFGFYIIGLLQIGKTYSITLSKEGYINRTYEVTLTKQKPIQMQNFYMWPDLIGLDVRRS